MLGEHAGAHVYTVGQRHGLGIAGREPLYVLATDARANTVTVGPRDAAARARHARCARRRCTATVAAWTACACAATGAVSRAGCPADRAGRHARLGIELDEPAERTAPGQLACLYAGDVIVGHGTMPLGAAAGPKVMPAMTSDEIRERYLSFFEERGHRRMPSASLVPSAHDPSALLTVAACTR